jgi:hypothetical protein
MLPAQPTPLTVSGTLKHPGGNIAASPFAGSCANIPAMDAFGPIKLLRTVTFVMAPLFL